MSVAERLPAEGLAGFNRPLRPPRRRHLHGSDLSWAIAFVAPYAAVFLAFAIYPIGYALWMGSKPALYADLFDDPLYLRTLVNTLLFAGLGVNLQMFLALLLSGFFMRRRWWIRALLAIYILPWALSGVIAFTSVHWILIGEMGLVNRLLEELFGIEGPMWFSHWSLAFGANVLTYIWKWMPFWTVIFIAGRMMIPKELLEAAVIDGATDWRRFVHITIPLLANLYLVCTLLATIWAIGEFNTVFFVSNGSPAMSTEVLATLGFRYFFDMANAPLSVAAMMSALPVLIPIVILLLRHIQTRGAQL